MSGGQVLEQRKSPEIRESILETWCEICGATGPTADITGLSADAAMQVYEAGLKPWLTEHAMLIDEKSSYRTAVGAKLFYHQPKFGPRESKQKK